MGMPPLLQDNVPLGERLARRWLDDWRGAAALVALLAVASSITSLTNGFAYDDLPIIYEGERLHDWRQLWRVFGQSYWFGEFGRDQYRPLTLLSFGVQWAIGGGDPTLFHVVNLVLYAAVSVAVLALGRRLLPPRFAALGAALWAVHPLHVEAVGNAVGQAELLVALAVVGGLVAYIDARTTDRFSLGRQAAIASLGALGLLSKEHAIVFPGLLVMTELVLQRAELCARGVPPLRVRLVFWLVSVVTLGYLAVRWRVLGAVTGGVHLSLINLTDGQRILAAVGWWPEIARLFLWPARLYADYSPRLVALHTSLQGAHLLSALLLAGWLAAVWSGWRRRGAAVLIGALWFPIAFLPVSNLLFPTGLLLAERTLFLPSVALALLGGALAWIGSRRERLRPSVLLPLVTILLVAGMLRSMGRQRVWEDSLTVFTTLVAEAPQNARGHLALGELYMQYGAWERAERHLVVAQGLEPVHRMAYATLLSRSGRCREALTILDSALVQFDRLEVGHVARITCLLNERRFVDARERALDGLVQGLSPATFSRFLLLSDSLLAAYDSIDARNRWVVERRPFDRTGRPFAIQVTNAAQRPIRPIFDGGRPRDPR